MANYLFYLTGKFSTGVFGTLLVFGKVALFGTGALLGREAPSRDVRGLNQTGVGGKDRLRLTSFSRIGAQVMLQNLLIGGETLPLLMRFSLAFLTLI